MMRRHIIIYKNSPEHVIAGTRTLLRALSEAHKISITEESPYLLPDKNVYTMEVLDMDVDRMLEMLYMCDIIDYRSVLEEDLYDALIDYVQPSSFDERIGFAVIDGDVKYMADCKMGMPLTDWLVECCLLSKESIQNTVHGYITAGRVDIFRGNDFYKMAAFELENRVLENLRKRCEYDFGSKDISINGVKEVS